MPTIDELATKYGGTSIPSQNSGGVSDIDYLANKYGGGEIATSAAAPSVSSKTTTQNVIGGVNQGVMDVANTLSGYHRSIAGKIGSLIGTDQPEANNQAFQEYTAQQKGKYKSEYGDSTAADIGRVGGQVLATAPLLPGGVVQGVRGMMGALPISLSTGEKIAAPVLNRLGAAAATGGLGGAAYGVGTSGTSENSLPVHVGENALGGIVGGPILERAGALASKIIPGVKNIIGNAAINGVASRFGINSKAAKQILTELENEGITLAEAQSQLSALGSDATIADLTPALQKIAGALGQRGGRSTSIVENRFANRASTADNNAHNIMVSRLGPKPDLEAEKEAIFKEASRLTGRDYGLAHASPDKLPINGLVSHIDNALENAVGQKASVLKEIKGYLFKADKSPKDSVAALHEARQGIDDILNKRGDSLSPNAHREVTAVRKALDIILKTNSQMAAADEKFAAKMTIAEGLEIGSKSLNKGNYENFEKVFNGASPELKETIKKGMRSQIGDLMEAAARGELAGAQQLLGRKSANRKKLELAFGSHGTDVLDALANEATKRSTEKTVAQGSRTAINQRINALFDSDKPKGVLQDALVGAAMDATTGSLGTGTAIMAVKRGGGNILTRFGERRKDAFAESTADIISRSGTQLPHTMDALNTIHNIQNTLRLKKPSRQLLLPVNASSIVGTPIIDYAAERAKNYLK